MPPRRLSRVQRVRAVLAGAGPAQWAGLAVDAGCYDQSRMAAGFRALMEVTPTAFRAGPFLP